METLLTKKLDNTLIIGIGNNTRQDDGLGWCFLDALEKEGFNTRNLLYKYPLMVEDAEIISNYDIVIFVDAYKKHLENGFLLEILNPSSKFEFTTHSVPPSQLLSLCNDIYQKQPKSYILKIEGFEWDYETNLSDKAKQSLENAISHFLKPPIIEE